MKRLDADLLAEIKRRTEMNKSTQMVRQNKLVTLTLFFSFSRFLPSFSIFCEQWFEGQLSNLSQTFNASLDDRNESTAKRLDELNQRITDQDTRFEKEKTDILRQIDERGEELARLLNQFKAEFEEDRLARLEREAHMVKQLTDNEHETAERFESQIVSRNEKNITLYINSDSTFFLIILLLLFPLPLFSFLLTLFVCLFVPSFFFSNLANLGTLQYALCWKATSSCAIKRKIDFRYCTTGNKL